MGSVLIATNPIFAAVFAHLLVRDDRLSWLRSLGLVVALAGTAVCLLQDDWAPLSFGFLMKIRNDQTGEYEPVSITDMGTDLLSVEDRQIESRRFRLEARDTIIDLWYTKDMHWLALESETESGSVLRYLPDNLSELALGARS